MSGATATVVKIRRQPEKAEQPKIITLTPEMAVQFLERNQNNRPLSDLHGMRLARQIKEGKWRFNGDTIKISEDGDVLDGQHRLWACIEANMPIQTVVVNGIKRDAFSTIDTLRKMRSGADTIALNGTSRYRNVIASALSWLLRWQRGCIVEYRAPENKIENSDIEEAFRAHPEITRAVERAMVLRRLCNVSIMAFFYYALSNRNQPLSERMLETLENPAKVALSDPFFRLRNYFTADHHEKKDSVTTIALAIKAANAAHVDKKLSSLIWRSHGKAAEPFPTLDVGD